MMGSNLFCAGYVKEAFFHSSLLFIAAYWPLSCDSCLTARFNFRPVHREGISAGVSIPCLLVLPPPLVESSSFVPFQLTSPEKSDVDSYHLR